MKIFSLLALSLLAPLCARAGLVTLAWDTDTWPDTTTYTVTYWRYHTSQYHRVTVAEPRMTLDLPNDQTFCAYVVATNASGQTSAPSATIFF